MRIVVTGGAGFIGKNLRIRLRELGYTDVASVTRATTAEELREALLRADFVFHLAGVNRPRDVAEFDRGNTGFTETVCSTLAESKRAIPLAYVSSTQALLDNPYGASKRAAEDVVAAYGVATHSPVFVLRFPNVFGKWSRPNYNSAIATFCYNLTRGLPIAVNDATTPMSLLYVDDAVSILVGLLDDSARGAQSVDVAAVYRTTLGEVVSILQSFVNSRRTLTVAPVGSGLTRALYATYLSFLPATEFAYPLKRHTDSRGGFVEMLKTADSGQFSYFTAPPGVTRGEHYHHTKSEKFLVVRGKARFAFRHLVTDESHELVVDEVDARVVDTVPGWAHSITNVGSDEMIVMLWANEVFDPERPDTIPCTVKQ